MIPNESNYSTTIYISYFKRIKKLLNQMKEYPVKLEHIWKIGEKSCLHDCSPEEKGYGNNQLKALGHNKHYHLTDIFKNWSFFLNKSGVSKNLIIDSSNMDDILHADNETISTVPFEEIE